MQKSKPTEWYASITNGAENIVMEMISKKASNIRRLESAILFTSNTKIQNICFHQLFSILGDFHSKSLSSAVEQIAKQKYSWQKPEGKTFRIIVMESGKLQPLQPFAMHLLEKMVISQTGLKPMRANPDIEIWINRHNNGRTFFMVRMNKETPYDKRLQKGELRPDIIEILYYLADLKNNSIVCDPFGGSGAIADYLETKKKCSKIITGDIDEACVTRMKKRLSKKPSCEVHHWDATQLPLNDNFVDAVITDPPWGEFVKLPIDSFYMYAIAQINMILKKGGKLVLLTTAKDEASAALKKYGFGYTERKMNINGKAATIFVCRSNQ